MSVIDELIGRLKTEFDMNEILSDLESITVDESERILRDYFASKWKDDLREQLKPFADAVERGEITVTLFKDISYSIASSFGSMIRHKVVHHYFLKEIRRLDAKLDVK